jgi:hypothetical protein
MKKVNWEPAVLLKHQIGSSGEDFFSKPSRIQNKMNRIHRHFAELNRRQKIIFLRDLIRSRNISTVLIVGASAAGTGYGNMIERALREVCSSVVMSGLEPRSDLWEDWVEADGRNLPFADQSFDLVVSNAVIEHVGERDDQFLFASEHKRVGRNWVFTTPNRFFPVELHSGVLLRHMTGKWVPPHTTRLLSQADIRDLVGRDAVIRSGFLRATFTVHNR